MSKDSAFALSSGVHDSKPQSSSSPVQCGVHFIYLIGATGCDIMVQIDVLFSSSYFNVLCGGENLAELGSRIKSLKLVLLKDLLVREVFLKEEPQQGKFSLGRENWQLSGS